jgi:hypothetical protein
MTSGEKMVWASVFSREFMGAYSDPPASVMCNEAAMEAFEKDAAESAAEVACHVVLRLRSIKGLCEDNYGLDNDVVHMLNAMIGVEG